jgi:carbon-monoxide dehydrogenase medium subunit
MVTFYRRMPKFNYLKPRSIDELLDLLGSGRNGTYRIYAGGTDVIPKLKSRSMNSPEFLVDLKGISGLDYIRYEEESGMRIGALATIRSVAGSQLVKDRYPILSQAAGSIASTQVQNRGTIAGNLCSAVPSADSAPALLCLGARLLCVGKSGERRIGIEDFFKGPGETTLNSGEFLKEIQIPPLPGNTHGVYIKLSTRHRMDLAIVGVAASVRAEKGVIEDIRIGLGAVAPTPIRARMAEETLKGREATDEAIEETAQRAMEESKPIDDHRASAAYRKMMVKVLVKRAVPQAFSAS